MKTGISLETMEKTVREHALIKKDFVAPTSRLEMYHGAGGFNLLLGNYGAFEMTDICHAQVAERVKIPKAYYDRMKVEAPALLKSNVETWFHKSPEKRMIRTLGDTARAFLSDRYRPLDNFDLVQAILPAVQAAGCRVESCQVTERKLYLYAVSPKIQGEVKVGDTVQAGIEISNSEVGLGSLSVSPLVYTLRCLNGMVLRDSSVRKNHLGKSQGDDFTLEFMRDETREANDRAFWLKVRDVVQGTLTEAVFHRMLERMKPAVSREIEDPIKLVENVGKRFLLSEDERAGVLKSLVTGGDMTQYGLHSAVTAYAQKVDDYDRAADLQALGGDIVVLEAKDWSALN